MSFKRPLSVFLSPSEINDNKSSSKSNTCKVCDSEAHGNSYGARSCQSCKVFFRRNGFRPELVGPCRYDGQCEVNISTRNVCTSCRLAKCFTVGMCTDHIRKEDLTNKKSSSTIKSDKTQVLQHQPILQMPTLNILSDDRSLLTTSEWTLFSNVLHAYDTYSLIAKLDRILKKLSSSSCQISFDTADVLETIGSFYTSMQLFVGSTPDFQVLSLNEQRSLFKRNLHGISSFCSHISFRDTNFFENSNCYDGFRRFYSSEVMKLVKNLLNQLDLDSMLLKLMILVISFSSNCFIVNIHENIHDDSLLFGTFRLFGSQNVYVELLWKYMLHQYSYNETVLRFAGLVKQVLNMIRQSSNIYTNNDIHHDFIDKAVETTNETLIIRQNEPVPLWGMIAPSN